jgi:hypothetical protein
MIKRLLFIVNFSVLFFGCSSDQVKIPREVANNEATVGLEKSVEVSLVAANAAPNNPDIVEIEKLSLEKDKKRKLAKYLKERSYKRSIMLNGEKFTLHSDTFGKGSKVYNRQIKEYGLIKGSIVVVSRKPTYAKDLQYPMVEVVEIAKNTFRLRPEKTVELMLFYKNLIRSKRFSVVEMQVDYSQIKERAEY